MKRLMLLIGLFGLLCFELNAQPMRLSFEFSGVIEASDTTRYLNFPQNFTGRISYLYAPELSLLRDPLRPYYTGDEIELSYHIQFDTLELFPWEGSGFIVASFDRLASITDFSPDFPNQIPRLTYIDEMGINLLTRQIWFSGINVGESRSLGGITGNITYMVETTESTQLPEPSILFLFAAALLSLFGASRLKHYL